MLLFSFCLVAKYSQTVEERVRLSSLKQMEGSFSTLGVKYPLYSSGTLSGICVVQKANDTGSTGEFCVGKCLLLRDDCGIYVPCSYSHMARQKSLSVK